MSPSGCSPEIHCHIFEPCSLSIWRVISVHVARGQRIGTSARSVLAGYFISCWVFLGLLGISCSKTRATGFSTFQSFRKYLSCLCLMSGCCRGPREGVLLRSGAYSPTFSSSANAGSLDAACSQCSTHQSVPSFCPEPCLREFPLDTTTFLLICPVFIPLRLPCCSRDFTEASYLIAEACHRN